MGIQAKICTADILFYYCNCLIKSLKGRHYIFYYLKMKINQVALVCICFEKGKTEIQYGLSRYVKKD